MVILRIALKMKDAAYNYYTRDRYDIQLKDLLIQQVTLESNSTAEMPHLKMKSEEWQPLALDIQQVEHNKGKKENEVLDI